MKIRMKIRTIIGNSLYLLSRIKLFPRPCNSSNFVDEFISGYGELGMWEFQYPATILSKKINKRFKEKDL